MPIIKIAGSRESQREELKVLVEDVASRLTKFCATKLREFGLITEKFTYEFDFNHGRNKFQKSASRFVSVLKRKVTSENPYIEKCTNSAPLIQVSESGNGVFMIVSLARPSVFSKDEAESESVISLQGVETKHIDRYVRYINYLCDKHDLPIVIRNNNRTVYTERVTLKGEDVYKHAYKCVLSVVMGVGTILEDFIPYPTTSEVKASLIGDPGRGESAYLPPELIFTVVPQIMKVIKTLTRETDYDYTAFGVERTEVD